jgi:proteasome lid subunit RPN8/RPN11
MCLASGLHATIMAWAMDALPHEAVALLLGTIDADIWQVSHLHSAANVASDPVCYFEMDPVAWLTADAVAQATGCAIIGVVHTHPVGAARPSVHDASNGPMLGRQMVFAIWAIEQGIPVLRAWRWDGSTYTEVPIRCNP